MSSQKVKEKVPQTCVYGTFFVPLSIENRGWDKQS